MINTTSQNRVSTRSWLLSLLLLCFAISAAAEGLHVSPQRGESAPRIDGELNDLVWRDAAVVDAFVQQRPAAGSASTASTVVRLLYTTDALYIGFECEEWAVGGVLGRSLGRDVDFGDEDSFGLVIDTFDDDQNAFAFHVNPNGARTDLLVRAEGEQLNYDWDGIWAAKTKLTDTGWQGEIEIPWRTLRFPDGDSLEMGLNIERNRRGVNEQSHWGAIPRQFKVYRVSLAGQMGPIEGIEQGLNVQARPYVLARSERGDIDETGSFDADDWTEQVELGLDVKAGLSSSFTLDLTVNPDFAEVEIDDQIVNFTRFPINFPEKREFFLEKANLFRFGPPYNQPFRTRAVGLDENGHSLPILYGARLTGKVGGTEIGLMDALQRDHDGAPSRRFDVVRVSQDVGHRSRVGAIAARRETGSDGDFSEAKSHVAGLDADLNPTDNFLLSLYSAMSDEDGTGADDLTWGGRARWSHPLAVFTLSHEAIGNDYRAPSGFVERSGVDITALGWEYTPEPNWKLVRRFENQGFLYWVDRRHEGFESRYIHINPVLVGPSEERLSVYWERDFDRLYEPFALGNPADSTSVVIPENDYDYDYFGAAFETDASRWWSLGYDGTWGDFFDGTWRQNTLSATLRRAPHWSVALELQSVVIEREGDKAWQRLESDIARLRVGWDLNNAFGIDVFTQYNAKEDLVLSQFRAHWIFGDESDLYFVFTDAREDDSRNFAPRRGELTLKLGYARQL